MENTKKRGFTLIEILIVVAVILLLAGMLFRIGNVVSDRAKRARAIADMHKIANALDEYYAVYGSYPPVNGVGYKRADPSLRPPIMAGELNPDDHKDGLVAYLYGRGPLDPMQDIPADVRSRWSSHLAGLDTGGGALHVEWEPDPDQPAPFVYSNQTSTIRTPWKGEGREYVEYKYKSKPPYLSYELYTSVPKSSERLSVSSAGQ